jgi:hypothetical protein
MGPDAKVAICMHVVLVSTRRTTSLAQIEASMMYKVQQALGYS